MVTATLKDSGPTTTITFECFPEIDRKITAENFNPFAYPDNEGAEIVFEMQWFRVFKIKFQLKDDTSYPASGDSCADKRTDLEDLIMSGGDSSGLFTLTFDSEDSTPSSSQTESYTGKVKYFHVNSKAGENLNVIEGDFEFWESDT